MQFNTIQIMRGIAALMVLFYHSLMGMQASSSFSIFRPGFTGVSFFFVLSGFIIFYGSYKSLGIPSDSLPFIKRRFLRIFPIHWIYLLTIIIITYPLNITFDSSNIIKSLLLLPYDVLHGIYPINPVAWSLSFEVFFYLLFSIAICLNKRRSCLLMFLWFTLILLSFNGFIDTKDNYILEFILSRQIFQFIFGCLIAYISIKRVIKNRLIGMLILLSGIICLVIAWINTINRDNNYDVVFAFGIPYSLIILGVTTLELHGFISLTKNIFRPFIFLGDASYSIYLIHFWTLSILENILITKFHLSDISIFITSASIAISAGLLAYQFIEKPLMNSLKTVEFGKTLFKIKKVPQH